MQTYWAPCSCILLLSTLWSISLDSKQSQARRVLVRVLPRMLRPFCLFSGVSYVVVFSEQVADEPKSPTASGRSKLTTPANAHQHVLGGAVGGRPLPVRPGGGVGGRFSPPPLRTGGNSVAPGAASPRGSGGPGGFGGHKSLGAAIAELSRVSAMTGKPSSPVMGNSSSPPGAFIAVLCHAYG